jgi:antitoxin ParD1/3/4
MQNAEKLSITLTQEMVRQVRESVAAGEYASTSEAVRDAMRLWQRQRAEDAERLEAIRARIRHSIDDPRPSLTQEEAEARLRLLFAQETQPQDDAAA